MTRFIPVFFIALGLFGLCTIEFGVVGLMPEIIDRFGVTEAQAGQLTGIFALVVAVAGPFLVLLFSRFNRKRILLIALAFFTISSFASAFMTDFNLLLLVRMVPALFHPVYFSLAFVSAIALYPEDQAPRAAAHAFLGTSIGIVLGVPITAWIGANVSYEWAFYFTAVVNLIALLGVLFMLPQMKPSIAGSTGQQLTILKKTGLWLNIASTGLIFAGMFAVYTYVAEYLETSGGLPSNQVSLLLLIFGLGGVAGNMAAGNLLRRNKLSTVILHPLLIGAGLMLLLMFKMDFNILIPIMVIWGGAHTSSLVITQIWLTQEAPEAPEFATSLFASTANLGVAIGSAAGGAFINAFGLDGMFWSGWLFLGVALLCILLRIALQRGETAAKTPVPAAE